MILGCYALAADMEVTWRLWATIEAWWTAIEVFICHRSHQRPHRSRQALSRSKARVGDTEILPTTKPVSCSSGAARRAASTLTRQATTLNCEAVLLGLGPDVAAQHCRVAGAANASRSPGT